MSETVRVSLGERAYDILIGEGVLGEAAARIAPLARRKVVAIITDENVARAHLPTLEKGLRAAGFKGPAIMLPPGEETKSFKGLEHLCGALLTAEIERGDMVLAFGGGVIGDLAGLAAGLIKRGIDFVQVPTTLLAQVDSSVGGKTAINTKEGKNLVGLFHQPRLVLADVGVLGTLPLRELQAGYAEIVKYGLIGDAAFFAWLEKNGARVLDGDTAARIHAIKRSCEMKADIVATDEREGGIRALLNLGHTFGHALEAATGYSSRLLHGEAVAIGCVMAYELSHALGYASQADVARVRAHFDALGLKTRPAEIAGFSATPRELIAHMMHDKKVSDGRLTFVLPKGIGAAFTTRDVSEGSLERVLAS